MKKEILEKIEEVNNLLTLIEGKISKSGKEHIADERTPGQKDIPDISKQFLPHDSYTYKIFTDIWYQYPEIVYKILGAENNHNDYNIVGQSPIISFYSDVERDRYMKLFKKYGIKIEQLSDKDSEPEGTNTVSPVPSKGFRDIS